MKPTHLPALAGGLLLLGLLSGLLSRLLGGAWDPDRQKAPMEQFESAPRTTIIGVVDARGPVGIKSAPETRWSLRMNLLAWRESGEAVHRSRLVVTMHVAESEIAAYQERIDKNSLVRFEGKLVPASSSGDASAQLLRLLPLTEDDELRGILQAYLEPVRLTDSQFGQLTLDRTTECFEGPTTWAGAEVVVSLSLDEDGQPGRTLEASRALWKDMEAWDARVRQYAVSELLGTKNGGWLNEGEKELTAAEFLDRMALDAITVHADGSFEFSFADGDLFWGHYIVVSGSLSKGLTEAGIWS